MMTDHQVDVSNTDSRGSQSKVPLQASVPLQPSAPQRCYLGLGSNLTNELGVPTEHIQSAVAYLEQHPKITNVVLSSLYESLPMGPQDQPNFINAVVLCDTTLSPFELLELCQSMENKAHRIRLRHWGERSLDVDILLYGNQEINTEKLVIPHPRISERNFVLIPLVELNPALEVATQPIVKMTAANDWTGLKKL